MMRRALFGLPAAFLGVTSPGDKLRRPQNAPYAQGTPIGVQPGSPSITVAHIVIVTGAAGGLFVYSGTPGLGNPPITWMSNGTTDPYGNTLPSTTGVAGSGTFQAGDTIINPAGMFIYSSTPATGNLVASIAQTSGTDAFGNAYLGGLVSYFPVASQTAQIVSGQVRVFQGSGGITALSTADGVTLNVGFSAPVLISGAVTAGSTISATAGAVTLTGGTAGAPSVITTDSWHSMTLLNSWANNVSFAASRYKMMENKSVRVQGVINATAATAATFFTLPAGYIPSSASGAPVGCNAGAGASTVPTLRWDTSGNLTINNLTIPSASAVFFTQDIPLD